MPGYLFHQNMRVFGGAQPDRNAAYSGLVPGWWPPNWPRTLAPGSYGIAGIAAQPQCRTLPVVQGGPRVPPICVMGFTELHNGLHAQQAVQPLANGLCLGNFGWGATAFCGQTALAVAEYLGIFVAAWVTLRAVGRIAIDEDRLNYEIDANPGAAAWLASPPTRYSADYRMVVYVVVQIPFDANDPAQLSDPVAIGFVHNMFTLDAQRAYFLQRLPWIARIMAENGVATAAHVFIGGDFNVSPHETGTRPRLHPYAAITGGVPMPFTADQDGPRMGGTTWGGHLYDYWYTEIDPRTPTPLVPGGVNSPIPAVTAATWDGPHGLMSDHVATLLQIV
jgi:hypothetical protein